MKCSKCGSEVPNGTMFCDTCGSIIDGNPNILRKQKDSPTQRDLGVMGLSIKNKIVVALMILASIVFICGIINTINKNIDNRQAEMNIAKKGVYEKNSKQKSNLVPTHSPKLDQPTEVLADSTVREDLYNGSLYYKRMSEIHNTELTSDDVYYDIKNAIEDFDRTCEEYINHNNEEIFRYLLSNTTAYEQQVSYKSKHPNLKQHYISINVINTRMGDNYYYAWVSETLQVNENNIERVDTDHWVYKLSNHNGNWYINDYTRDPVYE